MNFPIDMGDATIIKGYPFQFAAFPDTLNYTGAISYFNLANFMSIGLNAFNFAANVFVIYIVLLYIGKIITRDKRSLLKAR